MIDIVVTLNIDKVRIFSRPGGLDQQPATDHRIPASGYRTSFPIDDSGLAPSCGRVDGYPPSAQLGVKAFDHPGGRPQALVGPESAGRTAPATAPANRAMDPAVRAMSADA